MSKELSIPFQQFSPSMEPRHPCRGAPQHFHPPLQPSILVISANGTPAPLPGELQPSDSIVTKINDGTRGWYTRGYLPHFDAGPSRTQFITFRLFDSLPKNVLHRIEEELKLRDQEDISRETFMLAERFLDSGHGECFLRLHEVASIVNETLLKFDGVRYVLYAWVVMPNHAHAMLRPLEGHSYERIMHSIKSFTASKANKVLGRKGPFWMREAFDRYIRDDEHFGRVFRYIENNPVKAGLCEAPAEWEFSSAYEREKLNRG